MFSSPTDRRGLGAAKIDQNVVTRHFVKFDITDLPLKVSQSGFGRGLQQTALPFARDISLNSLR